ncbi:hypothetical protein EFA69_07020 [Rufibacter immobilis]|uniref:Phytanoyl-CoA dioxygenase n=1 Tax=Rufibacter immobilis TaxID=1348778 RepID=A0A3M9N1E6_9BACT|nr:hypothetical protein [Rufibacter immobilis]RNI30848.1 hypothetical protein EFA69_07020 [Rufibacter immobilis]
MTNKHNPSKVTIDGERAYGEDIVLLHQHDNLILHTDWNDDGYLVAPLFNSAKEWNNLIEGLASIFFEGIRLAGINIPSNFQIEHYHHLVKDNQILHLQVMAYTKLLQLHQFPTDVRKLTSRVSDLVGVKLKAHNPQTNEQVFHLRVIRPGYSDFNPLHRDVWLDIYRDCVNIYVPVAGSTSESSLPVVPGSHYWPESEVERTIAGAVMNGSKYNVPGLTGAKKELNLIRPNPLFNEILVFSPYLIHGGAANLNYDQTRVSLEMRFWRE